MEYKIINRRKRSLVRAADLMLELGARLKLLPTQTALQPLPELRERIKRILIVRLAYIGDIVMTQPVIAPLRSAFPNATIDFMTSRSAAPLLESDPDLDSVIPFDAPWFYSGTPSSTSVSLNKLITGRYDLGIDFRADLRNIWHCLYRPKIRYRLSYTSGGGGVLLTHPVTWSHWQHKVGFHLDILRLAGIDAPDRDPVISISAEEAQWARARVEDLCGGSVRAPIIIHPGSRLPLKCWPAERFIELIGRINEADLGPVILVEAPGNEFRTSAITEQVSVTADLTGQLTIRQMASLFQEARFLVCHDSAPMHIAAAVGCRTVALFGPSRSLETAPCGSGHQIIEAHCPHKAVCDENVCLANRSGGCMMDISVDEVFERCCTVGGKAAGIFKQRRSL